MNILLTGGTGFIGSHTAVELLALGHRVVLYDNLSNSSAEVAEAIARLGGGRSELIVGDIRDRASLSRVLAERQIELVIHFAGLKAVGESCAEPLRYYDNNVSGSVVLLDEMRRAGVRRIIFSSSATVYGTPTRLPLTEDMPTGQATNPYGHTKLIIEGMLAAVCAADPSFTAICLRYFNPIGAHPSGLLGEVPSGIPNNLLPYVARVATGQLEAVRIFGDDYPTRDGTGIRDYIHVVDLARGHAAAIARAMAISGWEAINLGTGRGYSVLEVIKAFETACGHPIARRVLPRREGDVAENWSDPGKAERLLGWRAEYDLEQMCRDSWNFERRRRDRMSAAR